jgi:hypothetical protein
LYRAQGGCRKLERQSVPSLHPLSRKRGKNRIGSNQRTASSSAATRNYYKKFRSIFEHSVRTRRNSNNCGVENRKLVAQSQTDETSARTLGLSVLQLFGELAKRFGNNFSTEQITIEEQTDGQLLQQLSKRDGFLVPGKFVPSPQVHDLQRAVQRAQHQQLDRRGGAVSGRSRSERRRFRRHLFGKLVASIHTSSLTTFFPGTVAEQRRLSAFVEGALERDKSSVTARLQPLEHRTFAAARTQRVRQQRARVGVPRTRLLLFGRFGLHVHAAVRHSASQRRLQSEQARRDGLEGVPEASQQHTEGGGHVAERFGAESVQTERERLPPRSLESLVLGTSRTLLQSGLVARREREEFVLEASERNPAASSYTTEDSSDWEFERASDQSHRSDRDQRPVDPASGQSTARLCPTVGHR